MRKSLSDKFNFYRLFIKDLSRPWLGPLISLGVLFLFGALGYRITEGWNWGDCLWMVLITVTTIGFGEVEPLSEPGRMVTLLIIAGGLIVIQLTLQRLLGLSETGYFRRMRDLKFHRQLRKMENHIVICGYGRIGKEIAAELQKEKVPTLIVEIDPQTKANAEAEGLKALLADATLDETLLLAGINRCRSLVVTLPSDASNLYVVLSAKGLCGTCRLIARAETEEATKKLTLAGASIVISPYVAAGKTMAHASIEK